MSDEFTKAALYGIKTFNKKVKEKIGMEKLIELLNEYRKEKGERNLNEFEISQTLDSLNYLKLFIKWLIENEKIDLGEKIFNLTKDDNKLSMVVDLDDGCFSWEETLLMLLSIQDEPINFLISILK